MAAPSTRNIVPLLPAAGDADVALTTVVATTAIDTPTIEATDPAPELVMTARNL